MEINIELNQVKRELTEKELDWLNRVSPIFTNEDYYTDESYGRPKLGNDVKQEYYHAYCDYINEFENCCE